VNICTEAKKLDAPVFQTQHERKNCGNGISHNFKLSAGHLYTFDTHFLTLGGEYGFGLGGGRMAALFAEGALGEGGVYSALAGLRIYFGQHDKPLIDRHRQDDPMSIGSVSAIPTQAGSLTNLMTAESEAAGLLFADAAIFKFGRASRPPLFIH
jgi:hypothetical protein